MMSCFIITSPKRLAQINSAALAMHISSLGFPVITALLPLASQSLEKWT